MEFIIKEIFLNHSEISFIQRFLKKGSNFKHPQNGTNVQTYLMVCYVCIEESFKTTFNIFFGMGVHMVSQ